MHRLFFFGYLALSTALYLIALPFAALISFKSKYRHALKARFFLYRNPSFASDGVWLHACSLGETRALSPLLKQLPVDLLRISTTTQTGYDAALAYTSHRAFLPFEPLQLLWQRPQKALVVMEAELWYLMFALARRKGAKTLLINARMSDRSFPGYRRFRWLFCRIFSQIDAVYAQTAKDKERLEELGAQNVQVIGSLKFADIAQPKKQLTKPPGELICAASTHEGEEQLILGAFKVRKLTQPATRLIVVPRHPERFDAVDRLLRSFAQLQGWSYGRYSEGSGLEHDIVLIDTLGDLIDCYAISDVVVLGGAFEPHGGHNPAEAAQFGCKIISGEHYFNQQEMFAGIEGITVVANDKLAETLKFPKVLPDTRIIKQTDITPIVEEIHSVL